MRPRRLYKTKKGGFYYFQKGKKRYIKIPKDMTQDQVVQINLKTLEKLINPRRVKRRKYKIVPKFEKPIVSGEIGKATSFSGTNIPFKFFEEARPVVQIEDIVKAAVKKKEKSEEHKELVQKLITLPPTPPTLPPTPPTPPLTPQLKQPSVEGKRRPTSVVKDINAFFSQHGRQPSLEEYNKSLNSKYIETTPKDFEDALRKSALGFRPVIDEKKSTLKPSRPTSPKKQPDLKRQVSPELIFVDDDDEEIVIRKKKPAIPKQSGLMPPRKPKIGDEPSLVERIEKSMNDDFSSLSPEEQAKIQMGFGSDLGLYNDQISKVLREVAGRIVPVVPADKVYEFLSYIRPGDKYFAGVVNTNKSSSDGSGNDGFRPGHWRAIFVDNRDDFGSCEYFDPLAEGDPEDTLVQIMRKISKKLNPEKLCLYKFNTIRRQAKEASTCGWHVLQFLDDRIGGVPWSEASGYDHYMKAQKPDDSKDGEKQVEDFIEKYKSFI